MAVAPSRFKLRDGEEFELEPVSPGMYTVKNAYAGVYEYFQDRPLETKQPANMAEDE